MLAFLAAALMIRSADSGAACFRVNSKTEHCTTVHTPKYRFIIVNIAITGALGFDINENGVNQCSGGTGQGKAPESHFQNIDVGFDEVFYHLKLPVGPIKGARVVKYYTSGKATAMGDYQFNGKAPNENCEEVKWPGTGGEFCTGSLTENSPKIGFALSNAPRLNFHPDKNHVVVSIEPLPADALAPSPEGCNDSAGAFHKWEQLGGGQTPEFAFQLNTTPSGGGIGSKSYTHGEVPYQLFDPAGFKTDCSNPAAEVTCSQSWSGKATVNVYKVGGIE